MPYYIATFAVFYIYFLVAQVNHRNAYLFLSIGMVPLIALVVLRGNVGTDTASYIEAFDQLRFHGENIEEFEPVFYAVTVGLRAIADNSRFILAAIGLLTAVLWLLSSSRLEKNGFIFGSCMIPEFFLDMTMNGIRYGLSFALVTMAASYLVRGREKQFWALTALAGLTHFSGFLLAFFLYAVTVRKWRLLLIGMSASAGVFYFFGEYLTSKFDIYEFVEPPSAYSGLAPLALSLAALLVWVFEDRLRKLGMFAPILLLGLVLATYALAQFSYAGLRLQFLVLFLIFLAMQFYTFHYARTLSRRSMALLVLVGLVALGSKFRNFLDDTEGLSPFVPYTFFWE